MTGPKLTGRYNIGNFRWRIELLKYSTVRDEQGGSLNSYEKVGSVYAMKGSKTNSGYQRAMEDDVINTTQIFTVRDIMNRYPIDENWRIRFNGYTYAIVSIVRVDDSVPFYYEIECTRLGG